MGATIAVVDIHTVITKLRQDTYVIYDPLHFPAVIYLCMTGLLALIFRCFESRIPVRGT